MPSSHSIILFMVSALALNLSPGPSILYILSRSIGQGREAGLVSVLGLATATLIHAMAAALGLSTLFVYSPLAFAVVKYLGAAYLVYLGITTLHSRSALQPARPATPVPLAAIYRQGVVTDLLNPKVALFFIAFLPQFVDPAAAYPLWLQFFILGTIVNFAFSSADIVTVFAASAIMARLGHSSRARRILNRAGGAILIGLGVKLAADRT
jgi:threonine/homoserine/homoserine lactone efflux protein